MKLIVVLLEIIGLVGLAAVCSGLNISIMALDEATLKRKAKLGDKHAKRILPLRKKTHLTLASILLFNVAVISATSLVLNTYLNGIAAGITSTLLIVVFGEVMPQALFASRPLVLTSLLSPFLKFIVFITYPLSKPLQLLLDKIFTRQPHKLQTRGELGIMISEHLGDQASELDDDEIEIMRNALQLSKKRVRNIMTPVKKTYWLTPDTVIDDKKIDELKAESWSRVPVFDAHMSICYGMLLLKDLVDINFDDHPYRVNELPLYPCIPIGSMTALDTLLRKFISSHTHLLPVEKEDRIIGIVTIEDLIEEIIGHEIDDETDR